MQKILEKKPLHRDKFFISAECQNQCNNYQKLEKRNIQQSFSFKN